MTTIIGIAGNQIIQSVEVFNGNHVTYTPQGFVTAIQNAGGLPIVLPIGEEKNAAAYISKIDKLLLAGGQDISPDLFGEEPHPKLEETNRNRDLFELALIKEAIKQNKPIFAVCRGMQLINVALGGTLYQDLSLYSEWKVKHGQQPTQPQFATHGIKIEQDSVLYQLFGENYRVNSYHHQAINTLAHSLKVTARSDDGIVESIESADGSQRILGVQWHPELRFDVDTKEFDLFKYFVNQL
ncbi:glutamine amidotransferase, class I [Enterococcus moraviensis ATCC BAA-383]|uniref:Glutamine amidotransferase, class I n=1 Tax=Enterococcus moraviensis ATCC BAA-383 TaxID=1158609 RepID=R2T5Q8_9ENTE|nr:gamma-glutamyl-gamma-aminobutyrate hydrolase family protein [Enterococcus moraviensis]EOI00374.1 glutamine amidotransferase, class I [Enterococcus moraviensis ATCC BAA-383]EOT73397.1 glutamine amidotransferase, class I [Enterococcus moraviensis ATCC BAA-383]OJG68956.1 glutamine amidotransferase, class I [Enterococcus moraviensis]